MKPILILKQAGPVLQIGMARIREINFCLGFPNALMRGIWIVFGKVYKRITETGGIPILGHIRDVRPEWVSFPCRKPADGCKFLTKNLRMGHNFDIILPGNGWFSSKLNKAYCSFVNFYCE